MAKHWSEAQQWVSDKGETVTAGVLRERYQAMFLYAQPRLALCDATFDVSTPDGRTWRRVRVV